MRDKLRISSDHKPSILTHPVLPYVGFEQKILAGDPSQSWKYFVRFPEILILLCVLITKSAWTNARH